jgi:hypothetical protein
LVFHSWIDILKILSAPSSTNRTWTFQTAALKAAFFAQSPIW